VSTTAPTTHAQLDAARLLDALKPWVRGLVDDMRARAEAEAAMGDALRAEHEAEFGAGRTGEAYGAWLEGALTQAAVAWVLATVFVRFLEDNQLIAPRLSGPGARREEAIEHETAFYRAHPTASATDYMLATFDELKRHRATALLFDADHVPLWRLRITGDAAGALLAFWRAQDPDTGALRFAFASPTLDTRFLGDLYQDLSEFARKRYALLQTPDFVEAFILARTLEPALERFGLATVKLIDPTCGSGHFLLGAFHRLLDRWQRQEPATAPTKLVERTLDALHGVDLNPYAAAIARFRLIVAGLHAAGVRRLADEVDWRVHVAVGDTLLCAPERANTLLNQADARAAARLPGLTRYEDAALLTHIFSQRYHAVVGNPPYITVKDKVLNEAYRRRYPDSCHKVYSLGAPFTEVFFRLAAEGEGSQQAGFVGMITADSFMKREFGKKLIETVLPRFNMTHVVSTSGAYIPGHGTPTVILYGTNEKPRSGTVRVVMGIQGEPSTPADPAKGLVWTALLEQIDRPGSESTFISVADMARSTLGKHPWSIGGGISNEIMQHIETVATKKVSHTGCEIGFSGMTHADDAFMLPKEKMKRSRTEGELIRRTASGESIRDFNVNSEETCIFPYNGANLSILSNYPSAYQLLWSFKTSLENRATFGGGTYISEGRPWWSWHQVAHSRLKTPLSLAFAFVATHNHFVLDRGGKVFKQTAPVIKLPAGATEDDYLGLLGLLNSSTAGFWLKQVCFPKDANQGTMEWENRFEFDGTKVGKFPIVEPAPVSLARHLDTLAQQLTATLPTALLRADAPVPTRTQLEAARAEATRLRMAMIAAQEELDWHCYRHYGLHDEALEHPDPPPIRFGERAFEIALARKLAAGEETSTWFERHGAQPVTELPAHWPADYRQLVERRLAAIAANPNLTLIEQPTFKRRWNQPAWEELEREALRGWLLDRLEGPAFWAGTPTLRTTRDLAARAAGDADFVHAVELYTGQAGADLHATIAALVASEAVPFLPAQRYTASGLRKRAIWEETWALQRREDAGEPVGRIPAPPKYKGEDMTTKDVWRLRGPLDVPKERFIAYPALERLPDTALVVGWAGWSHLEQAQALAEAYDLAARTLGWPTERLVPLLAGLDELLPWLHQWHHDRDPATGTRPSEDFAAFLDEELRLQGLTRADLRAWTPPAPTAGRRKKGS
jgi:hypothetical protein